jgi:hypothetical protein
MGGRGIKQDRWRKAYGAGREAKGSNITEGDELRNAFNNEILQLTL